LSTIFKYCFITKHYIIKKGWIISNHLLGPSAKLYKRILISFGVIYCNDFCIADGASGIAGAHRLSSSGE